MVSSPPPEPGELRSEWWNEIPSVRIAEVAGRQHGVIALSQLRQCGVGRATLSRWVRQGRLHRIHPRVYAVGHSSLSVRGKLVAALLYAGPGAALSHVTAAAWWGLLPDLRAERLRIIHVTAPRQRRTRPGLRVHVSRSLRRELRSGLAVTPVAVALRESAQLLTGRELKRALAEADYLRLLDATEVERELGRGRSGAAALRKAIERHDPSFGRTLSPLEDVFVDLCAERGLPRPHLNVTVAGLMVDALWPAHRLVAELDGHAAHGTASALARDRRRELRLRAAGYEVVRYSWTQVTTTPHEVEADLRRSLAKGPPSRAGPS